MKDFDKGVVGSHLPNEKQVLEDTYDFDLSKYQGINKTKVLRNCVIPELGLHIFNESQRFLQNNLFI